MILTTDELRAVCALSGVDIPAVLDGGWADEDIPVADVVALRGLLARGVAAAHPDGSLAVLDPSLGPLIASRTLVEVRCDGPAHPGRWLVSENTEGLLFCAEERPDLWAVRTADRTDGEPVKQLLDSLLEDTPESAVAHQPARVSTDLLVDADRARTVGGAEQVQQLLGRRGISPETAAIVVSVLDGTRATTTVRATRRVDSAFHRAVITWMNTASSGTWLVVPDDEPVDDMSLPGALAQHTELRPVHRSELAAEVADVLAELTTTEHV